MFFYVFFWGGGALLVFRQDKGTYHYKQHDNGTNLIILKLFSEIPALQLLNRTFLDLTSLGSACEQGIAEFLGLRFGNVLGIVFGVMLVEEFPHPNCLGILFFVCNGKVLESFVAWWPSGDIPTDKLGSQGQTQSSFFTRRKPSLSQRQSGLSLRHTGAERRQKEFMC